MNELRFDGQVVIVTGGGAGLGRAHCLVLAKRGAHVAVVDIDVAAALATCGEIVSAGGAATAIEVEADDGTTMVGAVDEVIARLGRLDGLVNNAGVAHDAVLVDDDALALDRMLDVHLRVPFHAVRASWSELVRRRGRIVNVVSNAALFGKAGMSSYAASKGALLAWTRSIALEADLHGVRVNAIAPVATTRLTAGLFGEQEDLFAPDRVSPVVVWLMHDSCAEQGQVVSIAGGAVARVLPARLPVGIAATAEDVRRLLSRPPAWADVSSPTSAAAEMTDVRGGTGRGRHRGRTHRRWSMTQADTVAVEQIKKLMADYCHRIDDGDLGRWTDLFEEDASLFVGRHEQAGRQAIQTWAEGSAAAAVEPSPSFRHEHRDRCRRLVGDIGQRLHGPRRRPGGSGRRTVRGPAHRRRLRNLVIRRTSDQLPATERD